MTPSDEFKFSAEVELFPQEGGWHYVRVPTQISEELAEFSDRGVIAVEATIGDTTWPTSLLPMGDGSHFVALNVKVRAATGLELGDRADVTVTQRAR